MFRWLVRPRRLFGLLRLVRLRRVFGLLRLFRRLVRHLMLRRPRVFGVVRPRPSRVFGLRPRRLFGLLQLVCPPWVIGLVRLVRRLCLPRMFRRLVRHLMLRLPRVFRV
jgi:hypothetical protein